MCREDCHKEFAEGLFHGQVTTAKKRGRYLYHVVYEDGGDEEDLNDQEFSEAYELFKMQKDIWKTKVKIRIHDPITRSQNQKKCFLGRIRK